MANRLKEIRIKKALSQKQLAKELNNYLNKNKFIYPNAKPVSYASISRWELGQTEPKTDTWEALAYILDVPTSYLMGTSNNHVGWDEWSKNTGYPVKTLQNEVNRLEETNRIDKSKDIQTKIGRAVKSLDFHTLDTTQGVILELENQLLQLKATVSDAFLDIKETPLASNSTIKVIKPDDIHVKKDMDADAYKAICKLLDETRYKLSEIPIKPEYNQFSKK